MALPPVNIPDVATTILALVVVILSNYLRSDKLPAWKNALIAAVAVLLTAIGIAILTNAFAGTPAQVMLAILAIAVYLLHHDLQFLLQYFFDAASPLLKSVNVVSSSGYAVSSNVQPIQIPAPAQPAAVVAVTPNPQPTQAPSPEQPSTAAAPVPPAPAQ